MSIKKNINLIIQILLCLVLSTIFVTVLLKGIGYQNGVVYLIFLLLSLVVIIYTGVMISLKEELKLVSIILFPFFFLLLTIIFEMIILSIMTFINPIRLTFYIPFLLFLTGIILYKTRIIEDKVFRASTIINTLIILLLLVVFNITNHFNYFAFFLMLFQLFFTLLCILVFLKQLKKLFASLYFLNWILLIVYIYGFYFFSILRN